jgi:hypothetical protein
MQDNFINNIRKKLKFDMKYTLIKILLLPFSRKTSSPGNYGMLFPRSGA